MRFLGAIGWIAFGFFLTPVCFFVVLGYYAWPEMIIHSYKFFVCWYVFYYTLEFQS